MSQTATIDHRPPTARHALDTNAGEVRAPAQRDFASGQRHDIASRHARCDFATGIRRTSTPSVTGDFATGMRTTHRLTTLGDFATGTRARSAPVAVNGLTSISALPVTA
jgi:hypothetical protein